MRIKKILSLPKTILFNFINFEPSIAKKLPIFINYNVRLCGLKKNRIVINAERIEKFMVRIGTEGSKAVTYNQKSIILFGDSGIISFDGKAEICEGINIRNNGRINFGSNFYSNKNLVINCDEEVIFGKNVLIGCDVKVRDNDGHHIMLNKQIINNNSKVDVGNNVWVCSNSFLLKGSKVIDDSVVALGSVVTKKFKKSNLIIGGNPARIIKEEIEWKE